TGQPVIGRVHRSTRQPVNRATGQPGHRSTRQPTTLRIGPAVLELSPQPRVLEVRALIRLRAIQSLVPPVTRRGLSTGVVTRRGDILGGGVDRVTGRGRGTGPRLDTVAVSDRPVAPMVTAINGGSGPVRPRVRGVLRAPRPRGPSRVFLISRLAPRDRILARGPILGETLVRLNGVGGSRSLLP
ncbi:MAG: hypothetical protein ABW185_20965, partial [Sedimenticola sp.]